MAQVHLRGVKKSYDDKLEVIHGIDMEIGDGEVIALIGPPGCAKSALLRSVAGLEPGWKSEGLEREVAGPSIYVTHDQIEAMTMADRLIVMNAGAADQIGTPMDVYDRPASVFVAGFIGSPAMNFLAAKIGQGGRSVDLAGTGTPGISLPLARPTPAPAGTTGAGRLRPQHLPPGPPRRQ